MVRGASWALPACLCSLLGTGPVSAGVISIPAAADNTLYEDPAGAVSNGAGAAMFAGLNAQRQKRRALLRFDLAASLPQGATVVGATLRLHNSATNADPRAVSMHRVLESWGEGSSNAGAVSGGAGVAAAPGDATWLHRLFPGDAWSQPGGAFAASAAASAVVSGPGFYEWSSPGLTAEVAVMLADPIGNSGWILIGDESSASSAKRFATREEGAPDRRPQLIVEFIPAPGTGSAAVLALGLAASRRRRS